MTDATDVTKVVINRCYGGFNLSDEASREYLRRTGQEWTEKPATLGVVFTVGGAFWSSYDLERTDRMLVEVVEAMGAEANGACAALEVVSLPKGTLYRIDEYDGLESIETADDVAWSVA